MIRRVGVALAVALAVAALASENAAAAPGLSLGFSDIGGFQTASDADAATNLTHAASAGATVTRIYLTWSSIEPTAPPTAQAAADPNWAGYSWAQTDATVRRIAAAGQRVEVSIYDAPAWAEGSGRPAAGALAPKGTWKPSLPFYTTFATALAKRYNGNFDDPLAPGTTLPAIRDWEPWNEPNLSFYLSPQWSKTSSGYKLIGPSRYRAMNNAFYKAVKAVNVTNNVIEAGTAPYGDLNAGDPRVMPLKWLRSLLCVRKTKGKLVGSSKCPTIYFDAANHHPYPIGPPRRHARNADDVVVPDVSKVMNVVNAAVRKKTVRPAKLNMPLWITEISWDSFPDPDGLSLTDQAEYLEGALYVLWKQGADVVTWFNLRDEAPKPSYSKTYQSGIFARGATPAQDTPKPSYTAFRFPFTAYRSEGVADLWGMSPAGAGPVQIQALSGSTWNTVATLKAGSNRIFQGRLRVGRGTSLRAVFGTDTSLTWKTF